jgi:ribosomal protein L23
MILIKYCITEKSVVNLGATFLVNPNSNKIKIKNEISNLYNVPVKRVRTMVCYKHRYHPFGNGKIDRRKKIKKAIVELKKGEILNIFK